jgi:hypothetical protein
LDEEDPVVGQYRHRIVTWHIDVRDVGLGEVLTGLEVFQP